MINSHDEIKNLLKASRTMLSNSNTLEESIRIKKQYGMLTEQDVNMTSGDTTKKSFWRTNRSDFCVALLCELSGACRT